jgi:hypothetical protein
MGDRIRKLGLDDARDRGTIRSQIERGRKGGRGTDCDANRLGRGGDAICGGHGVARPTNLGQHGPSARQTIAPLERRTPAL